ncbi:hypothetical protein MACH10_10610 [Thalassospira tepidiphila]|uniref:beta family protein n=1 Tax=Thalassospira tepidiphila TaxID=393657 RepID=UPI0029262BCE|nr:hypothetical protein MACH10_10610 [Thalassospira tepidiphila]
MSIDTGQLKYVPTIFLRSAELAALEELPDGDKVDLHPVFQLRPWMSAHQLVASTDKISKTIGDQTYYLDLDPFFEVTPINSKRQATIDFQSLYSSENLYDNWYKYISELPNATPCLRLESLANRNIEDQVQKATEIGRGFLAYIRYGITRNPEEVVERVCKTGHSDFAFVLDMLWSRHLEEREEWLSKLIRLASDARPEIKIVVTGSSFPDSFTTYKVGAKAPIQERQIYARLKARHNAASLVYGDWASTRPPSRGGGGAEIPPRIDYPTMDGWAIYRIVDGEDRFKIAAKRVVESDDWATHLPIWGTYLIENTVKGTHPKIDNLKKASAARINIHLHSQLRFDQPELFLETEDDYVD